MFREWHAAGRRGRRGRGTADGARRTTTFSLGRSRPVSPSVIRTGHVSFCRAFQKARAAVPPYIVAPLPRCSILLERHTHKNGGSTVRSILNNNDKRDGWIYWGYGLHQHQMIVNKVIHAMLGPRNESCAAWNTDAMDVGERAGMAAGGPGCGSREV